MVVVVVVRVYSISLQAGLILAHVGAENSVPYTKFVPRTNIYNAQFISHEEVCTKFI